MCKYDRTSRYRVTQFLAAGHIARIAHLSLKTFYILVCVSERFATRKCNLRHNFPPFPKSTPMEAGVLALPQVQLRIIVDPSEKRSRLSDCVMLIQNECNVNWL